MRRLCPEPLRRRETLIVCLPGIGGPPQMRDALLPHPFRQPSQHRHQRRVRLARGLVGQGRLAHQAVEVGGALQHQRRQAQRLELGDTKPN